MVGRVFAIYVLLFSVPLHIDLYAGLSSSEIEQKAFPNQGVWKTLQIGMIHRLVLIFGWFTDRWTSWWAD